MMGETILDTAKQAVKITSTELAMDTANIYVSEGNCICQF